MVDCSCGSHRFCPPCVWRWTVLCCHLVGRLVLDWYNVSLFFFVTQTCIQCEQCIRLFANKQFLSLSQAEVGSGWDEVARNRRTCRSTGVVLTVYGSRDNISLWWKAIWYRGLSLTFAQHIFFFELTFIFVRYILPRHLSTPAYHS